ncbi:MAG: tetratricopeptide repeat protein, partial [Myxococcota bacterium]
RIEAMTEGLRTFVESTESAPASSLNEGIDDDTQARLEALGYVRAESGSPGVSPTLTRDGEHPRKHVHGVTLLSMTKSMLANGRYVGAVRAAKALLETRPDNEYFRSLLGWSYLGLSQGERAIEIAQSLSGSSSQTGSFLLAAALTSLRASNLTTANQLAKRAHQASPKDGRAVLLYAQTERQLGRTERAIEILSARTSDPDFPVSLGIELSGLQASQGNVREAQVLLAQLRRRAPLNPSVHYNFALTQRTNGEHSAALASLERAIELSGGHYKAHLARIDSLVRLGRVREANEGLERLRQLSPPAALLAEATQILESVR